MGNCRTEGRPSGLAPVGGAVVHGAALVPWLQDCNPIITGLRHLTDYRNSYSAPDTIAGRVVSRALALASRETPRPRSSGGGVTATCPALS